MRFLAMFYRVAFTAWGLTCATGGRGLRLFIVYASCLCAAVVFSFVGEVETINTQHFMAFCGFVAVGFVCNKLTLEPDVESGFFVFLESNGFLAWQYTAFFALLTCLLCAPFMPLLPSYGRAMIVFSAVLFACIECNKGQFMRSLVPLIVIFLCTLRFILVARMHYVIGWPVLDLALGLCCLWCLYRTVRLCYIACCCLSQ